MTSMYATSAHLYTRMLTNLLACLDKAVAYAAERKFDPNILVTARLAPDMHPLSFQVQSATDHVKGSLSRLGGREIPSWPDTEKTIDELKARIQKALDYAATFSASDLEGSDRKTVKLKVSGVDTDVMGEVYLLQRALPNFYFHVTTAYDILRHNGVPVGKSDFLGKLQA
jgi:uncharacterized protein